MTKYEMVRKYYKAGMWSEKRVRDAVEKGWITKNDFKAILVKIIKTEMR